MTTTAHVRIVIGMLLMAASTGVAWYLVKRTSTQHSLSKTRSVVWKIALFYALWAVFNNLVSKRGDLGYVSFGILTAVCLLTEKFSCGGSGVSTKLQRLFLLLACMLVTANFAVVLPMLLVGLASFAEKLWGEDSVLTRVWGFVFLAYIYSNMVLWPYCGILFMTLPLGGSSGTVDNPRAEDADLYEPIETEDV